MQASSQAPHRATPWPVLRNALVSYMNTHRHNGVQGFVEMDVTDALAKIARAQKTLRIAVSFHAFMLHAMVRALAAHPTMVSYRHKDKLISFDDIDVLTPVEKRITHGGRIPVGYVVRGSTEIARHLRDVTKAREALNERTVGPRE
ncbi:MAG: hypothetical protein EOP80_21140, partial [Variovorax sp.]